MLRSLYDYRAFIGLSIRNQFRGRFARSLLGGLWAILNPLASVLMYALVLSHFLQARLPGIDDAYGYAVYLMAGIAAWSLFSDLLSRGTGLFIANANLIRKISFPRITLPVIALGSALVDYGFLLLAIVLVLLAQGYPLDWSVLIWILPLSLLTAALGLGMGLILGIFNVFVRDVGAFLPIVLQFGFWFTPIVYPRSALPETLSNLLFLNPLTPLVEAYQAVLVFGHTPLILPLFYPISSALLAWSLSFVLMRRATGDLVDAL